MKNIKAYLKNNYWIIFPVVHIIASFFYEHAFFNFDTDLSVSWSVPMKDTVSNTFEFVMTYAMSKIMACILIWMLWKLIFGIIRKTVPLKVSIIFGALFLVSVAVCVIEWPESLIGGGSSDHLITYLYAKNFVPFYWQSIFTGCLYAACFMVAPTPFSLPILQCLMVYAVLGYVYVILERYTEKIGRFKWAKYLTFAALIAPQFIDLMTNSWRCCFYTVLALMFFSMILEAVLLESVLFKQLGYNKTDIKSLVIILLIAALLSVWRSEGILYGALGFLAMLIWGCRYKWKKVVLWMAIFMATFFILGRPSSIGQNKYYGNDYLKVCFVSALSNVFNDSNANLTYNGGAEDVAAIETIVPLDVLKQYSYLGYIDNNSERGFDDIDQTGATDAESKAFLKACIRLLLHNPKTYIKTQLNFWMASFNLSHRFYIEPFHDEPIERHPFLLTQWNRGEELLLSEPGVSAWMNSPAKISAMTTANRIRGYYDYIWNGFNKFSFRFWGQFLLVVMDIAIVVVEVINFFKKNRRDMVFGWIALLLLGVLAATILMMPIPYVAYFYTFIYSSFMIGVFYGIRKFGEKESSEK